MFSGILSALKYFVFPLQRRVNYEMILTHKIKRNTLTFKGSFSLSEWQFYLYRTPKFVAMYRYCEYEITSYREWS